MDWNAHKDIWPHASRSRFVDCPPHRWHVQEMGSGPVVMLIHGAGGATQSWRHLMPLLARNFRVIAFDLPGQGFTKLGAQQRCGLDEMSADIQTLIGQETWNLHAIIGHSAGAAIALRIAEEMNPSPPVIGINAALGNFKGLAGLVFPAMAKLLAATPFVAQFFTASTARPGSVERLIKGTGSTLADHELAFYKALVSDPEHVNATLAMMAQWNLDPLLARLGEYPGPALLFAGENDKTVPPETSRDIALRMPRTDFALIPDLGHLAHEEDAEAIREPIADYLERVCVDADQ